MCPYLALFLRYSEIFVENRRLNLPHLFGAPVGVTPLEFRLDFWKQKTRVPGLSKGVVCVILNLAALMQYRRVIDGQTDKRIDRQRQHIPSRGKNATV